MDVILYVIVGVLAGLSARRLFAETSQIDQWRRVVIGVGGACAGGAFGSLALAGMYGMTALQNGLVASIVFSSVVLALSAIRELRTGLHDNTLAQLERLSIHH